MVVINCAPLDGNTANRASRDWFLMSPFYEEIKVERNKEDESEKGAESMS